MRACAEYHSIIRRSQSLLVRTPTLSLAPGTRVCVLPATVNHRRSRYWWWESVLQLQTLALVAAEVFGRALPVQHQALLLLCVLLITAVVNMACAPVRSRLLVVLEFMSFSVLAVTITLGLYFVGEEPVGAVPAVSACRRAWLLPYGSMRGKGSFGVTVTYPCCPSIA